MIQSLARAMRVLDYMARQGQREYSIAQLSGALETPASSIYRVLQTFCRDGYVLLDPESHLYRLGPALIPLGQAAGARTDLRTLAMPFLRNIARETGDDAFLMTLSGFHSQTLARAEGPGRIKIVESFETNNDLHCGANRKMLLAFQSEDFIEEYIRRGLKTYTPNTITDPAALRRELGTIRAEGVSFSLSEFIQGAMGVSAPVFDREGKLAASMGTSGPAFQVTDGRIREIKASVTHWAAELSRLLGYQGA